MIGVPSAAGLRDLLGRLLRGLGKVPRAIPDLLMFAATAAFTWAAYLKWGQIGALTTFGICAILLALAGAPRRPPQ